MVTVEDRFWAKVDFTDTCWLWTAGRFNGGYGSFLVDGRRTGAHRFAYELVKGPIPDGLEPDHLCRVRLCVNPSHLEAVTHSENARRGLTGMHARKTHCLRGHPMSDARLGTDGEGYLKRTCRPCQRIWSAEARKRARSGRF